MTKRIDAEAGKGAEKNFEKALERLEAIVQEMEGGKLGLEDMITRFEEGHSLVKQCSKTLNEVQKKIEVLVKKGGETVTEDLEEMPGAEEDSKPEAPF
jgi:exodeoxyribonuclease VII small subunit